MRFVQYGVLARTVGTAGALVGLLALTLGAVRAADDKIFVMKITLPTVNDSTYQFAKNYAAAVERIQAAGSRLTFITPANWARSRGKSKARNSGRSSAPSFRPSSLSASTSGST